MAFDTVLEQRVEDYFIGNNVPYEIKHMFGGSAFMVDDKMCVGIMKDKLMARVDPDRVDELVNNPYTERMIMGKKTMKGFLSIHQDGLVEESQLAYWIQICLVYNPIAKKSKKRR